MVIYICNPMTKEWIALKPEGCVVGDIIGLAFYPFGYSSNTRPIFYPFGYSSTFVFICSVLLTDR